MKYTNTKTNQTLSDDEMGMNYMVHSDNGSWQGQDGKLYEMWGQSMAFDGVKWVKLAR